MMKVKKAATVIIAALFVIGLLFAHILVIAEAGHECAGDNCPVCETIASVENLIKEAYTGVIATCVCCALLFSAVNVLFFRVRNYLSVTLVTLKIKLSN